MNASGAWKHFPHTLRLGFVFLLAVGLAGLVATPVQAAPSKPDRPAASRDMTVVTGPTNVGFCWSGAAGQKVSLVTTIGGYRRILASTRLVGDRRCPKAFPLRAAYRVLPPNQPGKHTVYEEVSPGSGFGAARLFALNMGVPGTWSPSQLECINYLWTGAERGAVIKTGPGLTPWTETSKVELCVPRLTTYSQEWVNGVFASYLVDPGLIPDARGQLVTSRLGATDFQNQIVAQAQSRFPGISGLLSTSRTTTTVVDALREVAERNLETTISDPASDPLLQSWLFQSLPSTRQEAETAIRKDRRWESTTRGRLTWLAVVAGLECAFTGRQCDAAARYEAQLAALPPMLPRWPLF